MQFCRGWLAHAFEGANWTGQGLGGERGVHQTHASESHMGLTLAGSTVFWGDLGGKVTGTINCFNDF